MVRVIGAVIGLVVLGSLPFLAAWASGWNLSEWRLKRRAVRREIVLNEQIQQQAQDNYRLLDQSVRLHQRVLDADAVFPILPGDLQRDIRELLSSFYTNELPKEVT